MDEVLAKSKGISWQDFDGGMIILNPNQEKVHQLNQIGMEIFELIDGEKSLSDVQNLIQEKYDVSEDILRQDIISFVETAKDWGVLHER